MMIYDNIFGGTSSEHRFYTSRLFTILLDYVLPDTETHPVIFVDSYEDIMLYHAATPASRRTLY